MSKEQKMLAAFSNILYVKEGIRIAPKDLKSTKADNVLSEETIALIEKYKHYFDEIENIVEFIDDIRNPYGIYSLLRDYAKNNGTQHKKKVKFVDNRTGEESFKEIDDYYEPDDPEEYVIVIIDHISLITTDSENGRKMSLHESITKLSSDYLIKLRNKYGYIPVVIQQQASAQESLDNFKSNKLKPSLDGLGDNKLTQRDADVIFGLFSPYRHEIPEYFGYDIKFLKDNIRFLEIVGGREGGAGNVFALYFDGAVNYFTEMPKPTDSTGLKRVYDFIKNVVRI